MKFHKNVNSSVIHKAGWVVIDPYTIVRDGFVHVDSGLIKDIGRGSCSGHIIDHGPGALLPVLVNAHTHLELCALKDKVLPEKGFRNWVENLINLRNSVGTKNLKTGAINGVKELIESGCGVIGEISTLGLTWKIVSNSSLRGVWFREFLGNVLPEEIACNENKLLIKSIAGHAPHTLSPELLADLKNITRKKNIPFSIHLAESEDEIEFLQTGKGKWAEFLSERGIDFSSWNLPVETPVRYLEDLGVLDENTIAVHLIHTDEKDFEILLRHNVRVCLCLRSNFNLHNMLPDLAGMLKAGIKPCLGTDSLASADSLSIFDEMTFVSKSFPSIPPAEILAMATLNGASSLGFGEMFGSLTPGKRAAFVYVPVNVSSRSGLLHALVNADFKGSCKTILQ
ncbi:MAG: amidohydrolase family protein [Deltaproteobacteria bacterium]|nr:amidohydrolase family protein [Deltaproteobacteria bacterium]MBW2166877.1 amidohydrolase family protein [Deltaproteobacteria bacterium]